MSRFRSLFLASAAFGVLCLGNVANADIIYDNLSASSGATSAGDAAITPPNSGPLADSFSTGSGLSSLTDLQLDLKALDTSDGGSFTVSLLSDSNTSPGTVLATIATVSDSSLTTSLATYDFPLGTPISLDANTRYWIELSGDSTSGRWSFDSTNVGFGVTNEYNYFSNTSYANSSFTPYQMTVTTAAAVPEPASLGLVAFGIATLAIARRRLARR